MKNLVVDIGNSFAKAGLFTAGHLEQTYHHLSPEAVLEMIKQKEFDALLVSSVAAEPSGIREIVDTHPHYFLLNTSTLLPFQNQYQTPQTLGTDRVAAIAGAISLFPRQAVLAIDAGTCITYDIADKQGNYYGGSISPGLQMRGKAMHTFTARLPLVNIAQKDIEQSPLVGYNTHTALQSGILYGTLAEITQMIRMYADKFGDLKVIICGGDASLLTKGIHVAHTFVPELNLIGLNRILEHNVS